MNSYNIFISYSHKDVVWLEKLKTHLQPYLRNGSIKIWDDTRIKSGLWQNEIEQALESADAAVLLVSPNFLESEFINQTEVPFLLNAAKDQGIPVFWIPVISSAFEETALKDYQAAHDPEHPLLSLSENDQAAALVKICKKIIATIDEKAKEVKKPIIHHKESIANIFPSEQDDSAVIAHCKDAEIYLFGGIMAPGGTLSGILTGRGLKTPRFIQVQKPDADWEECGDAKTIFVVDSPRVNPYSKFILNNYKRTLTGGSISYAEDNRGYVNEEVGNLCIQKIMVGNKPYASNKHSRATKENIFGRFDDYMVVMRLPGAIISNNEIDDDRIVWLVFGTTTKGTHAGVNLFREENLIKLNKYLSGEEKTTLPNLKYFEMVFRVSDLVEKVENFENLSLVHFAELRPKIECCAGDPPPGGVERFFQNNEPREDIPIYSVHLDPIAACNYKCPECIESRVRKKELVLSMRGICRILTDLRKVGCQDVHFYGGEPTLHPDFSLIVDLASSMGFRMLVVTNGSLLDDPGIFQSLRDAQNLHIRVSLDGHSQEAHTKHHGLRPQCRDIDKIKKSIIDLTKSGVTVSISYLLFEQSLKELGAACEYWKANGVTSFNPRIPMKEHGALIRRDLNSQFTNEEKKQLRDVIEQYQSFVVVPGWLREWLTCGDEPKTEKEFPYCYSGYYRIGISPYAEDSIKENLPKMSIPHLGREIHVTEDAWISMCLYYRYDERFGCLYPKDFPQWCKEGRIEKLASIHPQQRGWCDKTICSRMEANEETYSSISNLVKS